MIKQEEVLLKFLETLIVSPVDSKILDSLQKLFDFVLQSNKCLDGYPIPYHAITRYIYNYNNEIRIDDLNLLMDAVETKILESRPKEVVECFRKFKNHISLAATQKYYIQKIASDALEVAEKAEKAANEADIQAKSTIANYISILGIFASIIFTLFGGVNLIGSTVKLLEVNSRWPYLTFIIALLMICLLTLLNMMVKWINSMSNLKMALEKQNKEDNLTAGKCYWYKPCTWDFYTKSVSFFLLILLLSMCGMYKVNKENLFSISTETTTMNIPESKNSKEANKNNLEVKNQNKETTIVEKITILNHSNEKSHEKE